MGKSYNLTESLAFYLATLGGLGRAFEGRMPGTIASAIALVIRWKLNVGLLDVIILFFIGVWASKAYALFSKHEDPPSIVIDEVVGYFVAMLGLSESMLLPAFFLFRLLDIVKPFPIRIFEKLPAGWGIMLDDVVAGFISNALICLGIWFWGLKV